MRESISNRLKLACYMALLASCIFSTSGQLLMKWVITSTDGSITTTPFLIKLIFVLSIYSAGVICWIGALLGVRLSIAYPLTSINYIGILVGSYYFFDEKITLIRIGGVMLIFTGVLLVVLKAHDKITQAQDIKDTQFKILPDSIERVKRTASQGGML